MWNFHVQTQNEGQKLVDTNYFESWHARRGFHYLSFHEGVFRLLWPPKAWCLLRAIRTVQKVTISRGPCPAWGRSDYFELLFDDGSDNPFVLQLLPEQLDRLPVAEDVGRDFTIILWTKNEILGLHQMSQHPCSYRVVDEITLEKLQGWCDAQTSVEAHTPQCLIPVDCPRDETRTGQFAPITLRGRLNMLKVTPIGDFRAFTDGQLDDKQPEPGSWIQLLWPDLAITTHMICADPKVGPLPFIHIRHHNFDAAVLLSALPNLARYVEVEA